MIECIIAERDVLGTRDADDFDRDETAGQLMRERLERSLTELQEMAASITDVG